MPSATVSSDYALISNTDDLRATSVAFEKKPNVIMPKIVLATGAANNIDGHLIIASAPSVRRQPIFVCKNHMYYVSVMSVNRRPVNIMYRSRMVNAVCQDR